MTVESFEKWAARVGQPKPVARGRQKTVLDDAKTREAYEKWADGKATVADLAKDLHVNPETLGSRFRTIRKALLEHFGKKGGPK